jgi:hypothetical protein
MAETLVIAPAYFPSTEHCKPLVESAHLLGIPLQLYGIGEPWPWFKEGKIRRLAEEIRQRRRQHTLVLFVDAFDSFFLKPLEVIETRYHEAMTGIFAAGEQTCWPFHDWAPRYPECKTPWKYLNSGGVIGRIDLVLRVLEWAYEIFDELSNDDQCCWNKAFLEHPEFGISIDHQCSIFQTMSGGPFLTEGTFRNTVTGTSPCVLHYNGRSPGIEKDFAWWKEQYAS